MNVRRIAGEKNSAVAVSGNLALADLEPGHPDRIVGLCLGRAPFVQRSLKFLDRRIAGGFGNGRFDDEPPEIALHRENGGEAPGMEIDRRPVAGAIPIQFQIGQRE